MVGIGAAIALVAALWLLRRRIGRGPLAGVLFFAVTLSPVLGFVDFNFMLFSFVADRYQYLASIGITTVVVAAAAWGMAALRRIGVVRGKGASAVFILRTVFRLTPRSRAICRIDSPSWCHLCLITYARSIPSILLSGQLDV